MPQTRTQSLCSNGSTGDEETVMFPIVDVIVSDRTSDNKAKGKNFLSLRERRQNKLGFRKAFREDDREMLPLNVLIPNAVRTEKNYRWYDALKKVWHQKDPWQKFHLDKIPVETALRHRYDPKRKKWHKDHIQIRMENNPFNRGAMRQCFRLKKLAKFCHSGDWKHAMNYVAKRYIESVDCSVYFEDVKLQMDAKLWGEEYNRHNPPKKVDIFQMYVIEMINREGSPLYHLEHFIEGEYIKYNSNSGFVEDIKQYRLTPQAFSHFTFERSGHERIVVDVQGVGDLYTDPQIHTMDGLLYGDGNLGTRGMALFFHSHECNDICRALQLEPFDLSESEMSNIKEHCLSSPTSETQLRGDIEVVVSPTFDERADLTRLLSDPRPRTISTSSDLGSLPEESGDNFVHLVSIDDEDKYTSQSENLDDQKCISPPISADGSLLSLKENSTSLPIPSGSTRRSQLTSGSSDECSHPYDTSEYSSSLASSVPPSMSILEEQKRYGFHTDLKRPSCAQAEHRLQETNEYHLGDSILGQIHHELAKYHEIGRFALDGKENMIDWDSALFHEEHAAQLGVPEAIVTMSKIYLHLPRDVLVNCEVPETEENTNKGIEYMLKAAQANDRASMLYMAKAFETGVGLGTKRNRSFKEACNWYQQALQTQENDDHGEYDATMFDQNYLILAKQADMYRIGGYGLDRDPNRAGELYTEAADEAMTAMKGRLANQYYMKAEEAWGEVEGEE